MGDRRRRQHLAIGGFSLIALYLGSYILLRAFHLLLRWDGFGVIVVNGAGQHQEGFNQVVPFGYFADKRPWARSRSPMTTSGRALWTLFIPLERLKMSYRNYRKWGTTTPWDGSVLAYEQEREECHIQFHRVMVSEIWAR